MQVAWQDARGERDSVARIGIVVANSPSPRDLIEFASRSWSVGTVLFTLPGCEFCTSSPRLPILIDMLAVDFEVVEGVG